MSRTPAAYNMIVTRGATWEDEFTYKDAAGAVINLTGYEARMQVRTLAGQYGTSTATTLVMELLTTGVLPKLLWSTAATGRLLIKVSAADTVALNAGNLKKVKLAYSLELYLPAGASPEYVIPLVRGTLVVLGETTR